MARDQAIGVGDPAPEFALPSANGETVRLSNFRGKSEVVLYFYPKDDTPGCTTEACSFRDSFEDFTDAGATVIGISSDSVASHKAFEEKFQLPFTLVADEGGAVRKQWKVGKTLGLIPGRVTYVIDPEGVVRHVFSSQMKAAKHIPEALEAIRA